MNIFSLRLVHKITGIGMIGLVGVVLTGGIYAYGEASSAAYRAASESARTIFDLSSRIEMELLEGRRAEKDFLLRNDLKKVERQIEVNKSAASDIETLRGKILVFGKPDLASKVEALSASLKQYQSHFLAVVREKQQLGLDENSGLEGRLRTSVHDIESRVDQLHQPGLLVTMLMMRRHEKDFMLRHAAKYGDEMKKRAAEFMEAVTSADIPDTAKAELKDKLATYQRDFFAWMETSYAVSGEVKAMSESFAMVEPVIEGISAAVNNLKAAADQSRLEVGEAVQWQMAIAVLSIAFLVLGGGFFIGRSVSGPFRS